jgi:FkbM family methyltransferase
MKLDYPEDRIYFPFPFREQYFGEPFCGPVPNEVYIDAGAYDGGSVYRFLRFCGGDYKKIYAFEPDADNLKLIAKQHDFSNENVQIIAKGAHRRADTLSFYSAAGSSQIDGAGSETIDVAAIDDVVGDDAVTLIKMDIEGSELDALAGAKRTIVRNKPRLAICVYHKPEDILTIPLYIKSLVPEYRFYLRHYQCYRMIPNYCETVLYAV